MGSSVKVPPSSTEKIKRLDAGGNTVTLPVASKQSVWSINKSTSINVVILTDIASFLDMHGPAPSGSSVVIVRITTWFNLSKAEGIYSVEALFLDQVLHLHLL